MPKTFEQRSDVFDMLRFIHRDCVTFMPYPRYATGGRCRSIVRSIARWEPMTADRPSVTSRPSAVNKWCFTFCEQAGAIRCRESRFSAINHGMGSVRGVELWQNALMCVLTFPRRCRARDQFVRLSRLSSQHLDLARSQSIVANVPAISERSRRARDACRMNGPMVSSNSFLTRS